MKKQKLAALILGLLLFYALFAPTTKAGNWHHKTRDGHSNSESASRNP